MHASRLMRLMRLMLVTRVTRVTRAMHADTDGGVDVDVDVERLRRATHTQDPLSWLRPRSGVSPTAS